MALSSRSHPCYFFGNLHTLALQGMHIISGFVTNGILRNYLFLVDCPYGGLCETEVKSKANFWGEEHDNEVKLHLCPPGYCCQRAYCDPYDMCAENR